MAFILRSKAGNICRNREETAVDEIRKRETYYLLPVHHFKKLLKVSDLQTEGKLHLSGNTFKPSMT